jgi:hypothetical protein
LEKNELNHATTIYYLFSNYENIKWLIFYQYMLI